MTDLSNFSPSLLARIALSRVFCSNASVYTLETPFKNLSEYHKEVVEGMLRKKEDEGVMVVMGLEEMEIEGGENDKVGVIRDGLLEENGRYK
jgi:ABC-type transport system involved in cytochrome c biogenesis ATPase subunit